LKEKAHYKSNNRRHGYNKLQSCENNNTPKRWCRAGKHGASTTVGYESPGTKDNNQGGRTEGPAGAYQTYFSGCNYSNSAVQAAEQPILDSLFVASLFFFLANHLPGSFLPASLVEWTAHQFICQFKPEVVYVRLRKFLVQLFSCPVLEVLDHEKST